MGVAAGSPGGRESEITYRLLGAIGAREVVSQRVVGFLQPLGMEGLEGATSGCMERLAPGGEQALVDRLLGERVTEEVDGLGDGRRLVDELPAPQVRKQRLQLVGLGPQRAQQV